MNLPLANMAKGPPLINGDLRKPSEEDAVMQDEPSVSSGRMREVYDSEYDSASHEDDKKMKDIDKFSAENFKTAPRQVYDTKVEDWVLMEKDTVTGKYTNRSIAPEKLT